MAKLDFLSMEELQLAFKKLQAFSYFDNYDLFLREKIAKYKEQLDENLKASFSEIVNENPLRTIFGRKRIGVVFFPKQVETQPRNIPSNFYTNARISDFNDIKRPMVFCDMPIECHLVSVVWMMRYGPAIENAISKSSYGNRLIIDKSREQIASNRALFKPYVKQFQKWWANAPPL